jgi:lipase chaperone LimK
MQKISFVLVFLFFVVGCKKSKHLAILIQHLPKPETLEKLRVKKNPKLSDEERERRRQKMLELRNNPEFMRKQEEGFKNCKNMNYSPEFLAMQKIGYKGKK